MKKMISFILAVAVTAAVAVPAFAAAPTTEKVAGADKWTTSGSDAAYANKMMTVVAYAPTDGDITVESIQYIDQTVADENGAYAFTNYVPKDLPTTEDYIVKVGGEAVGGVLDAGVIEAAGPSTVAVTGTVNTEAAAAVATVSFLTEGTETAVATGTTTNSAFSVDVAPGTYDVLFSRVGYLDYKITSVPVTAAMALGTYKLAPGDVVKSGVVNTSDLGAFVRAFSSTTGGELYNEGADFDYNGAVNTTDLGDMIANFTGSATTTPYSAQ